MREKQQEEKKIAYLILPSLQVPAIVIGLCAGVLGAMFTYVNLKIMRFRNHFFVPHKMIRLLEPCIVIAIFSSLALFLPLAFPCEPKPSHTLDGDNYRLVRNTTCMQIVIFFMLNSAVR